MPSEPSPGRAERGPVQYAILALLAPGPRHGYDLRDAFEAALGGNWPLNSGQIYSSLERLRRDGLVAEAGTERAGGPDKHLWTLTEAGRGEVEAWFAAPVPRDYRLRDELYLKLMLGIVAEAAQPGAALQAQRRELFRELHDLTARRNAADPRRQLAQILLLESAIMHTEAELHWLDRVEARLADIRAQPPPDRPARPRGRPRRLVGTHPPGKPARPADVTGSSQPEPPLERISPGTGAY